MSATLPSGVGWMCYPSKTVFFDKPIMARLKHAVPHCRTRMLLNALGSLPSLPLRARVTALGLTLTTRCWRWWLISRPNWHQTWCGPISATATTSLMWLPCFWSPMPKNAKWHWIIWKKWWPASKGWKRNTWSWKRGKLQRLRLCMMTWHSRKRLSAEKSWSCSSKQTLPTTLNCDSWQLLSMPPHPRPRMRFSGCDTNKGVQTNSSGCSK